MPIATEDLEKILAKGAARRRWPRWIAFGGIVLALAAIGLWWWSATTTAGPVYVTAPVKYADLEVQVTATGSVEPTDEVQVSSELSGTVRQVAADYNDHVSAGQLLAKLDTDKLQATVDHAQATLAAAKAMADQAAATLTEAQSGYNRVGELVKRGSGTEQGLETARAALARGQAAVASAAANVQVAEADLKLDRANLAKAAITSPIDGIVLSRNVEVGQIVASSLQAPVLFTLASDLAHMELDVDIDEADIGKVTAGNQAEFTVEAYPNRRFPAVISQVRYAPETIDGVVTYQAVLSVDNADLALRPGMTATAVITVATVKHALVVPNAALRFTPPAPKAESSGSGFVGMLIRPPHVEQTTPAPAAGGTQRIWVLKNGTATAVDVVVGETDGTVTQIASGGLQAGDAVITSVSDQ
jgi:HlyD family secretion protein